MRQVSSGTLGTQEERGIIMNRISGCFPPTRAYWPINAWNDKYSDTELRRIVYIMYEKHARLKRESVGNHTKRRNWIIFSYFIRTLPVFSGSKILL